MLQTDSVFKTALTLLLSTMMALPTTSMAKDDPSIVKPGATEGVPVVLQEIPLESGQTAYFAAAAIPREAEEKTAADLAKHDPDNLTLSISGPDDPVLNAVAQTGYLSRVHTFQVADDPDAIPLLAAGGLARSVRDKLRAKIVKLNQFRASEDGQALMWSFIISGSQGGVIGFNSSSVAAGIAIATVNFSWQAFTMLRSERWSRAIETGGAVGSATGLKIASLFGTELSDRDKRIWETLGKFTVSWVVNTAQAAFTKFWTGDFIGATITSGFADSGWSGVQNNYNIWDAAVLDKYNQGKMSLKAVQTYMLGQAALGAAFEAAAYAHVPYIPLVLGAVTVSGFFHLAFGPEISANFARRKEALHVVFKSGVAQMTRPLGRGRVSLMRRISSAGESIRSKVDSCRDALASKPRVPGHRAYAWGDIQ